MEENKINDISEKKYFDSLNIKVSDANNYIIWHNYEEAKKILNDYLDAVLSFCKEDDENRYFTFKNTMEFFCSIKKLNIQKKSVWINLRTDEAYKLLGYIATEEGEFSKAIDYLSKGLYFNPMNLSIRFEYAETYKFQGKFDEMYKIINDIYSYIYDPSMLARYYRLLGYYHIEKQNYDLAYCLYAISIYYEDAEVAHHEINYIKEKVDNPYINKTTSEILSTLKQNNIPLTINQNNLEQLHSLVNEKEIALKNPDLVEYVNTIINIFSNTINESTEIKGLNFVSPKITSDDIFDDNKIILDEDDKKRIVKNVNLLKEKDIFYDANMKDIPFNSCTNLRSKEDILKRMLGDYIIAVCSLYSLDDKFNVIPNFLDNFDMRFGIKSVLFSEDINAINGILSKKISSDALKDELFSFERCSMLMWVLGLIDKPDVSKECNIDKLDNIILNVQNYDELLSKCNLRSKEEVLEEADLIFRYCFACNYAKNNGKQISMLDESVVMQHRLALKWVLNWKINNIMKDKINVKYERNKFNFNFDVSTEIHISNVTNIEDYNLLLAFSDDKGRTVISLSDLGPLNNCPIDSYFENNIKKRENDGWNVIGTYTLSSMNIKGGFKQMIINKDIPQQPNLKLGICSYFFVLNGHVVILNAIFDDVLDYSDVTNVQNSKINLLAMDILLSINENDNRNMTGMLTNAAKEMNYKLHANQFYMPLLTNFKKEEVDNPQIVFSATNGAFLEQLVSDGQMSLNETFEQRIDLVIKNTMEFMKKYSSSDESKMFYYKDYSNGLFNFKIYVLDGIIESNNTKMVIRQFNAYFIEPNFNDFYQLTISSPPVPIFTEILKLGVVDLKNDEITVLLDALLTTVMNNLKYIVDEDNK